MLGPALQTEWQYTYQSLGTVQFIMVVLQPDSVAAVQAKIESTGTMSSIFDLRPIEFPIVFRENGDWAQYVDEYTAGGEMRAPGTCIIDQTGHFYAGNDFMTLAAPGIDWVVRRVDELLGGRQPVDTILALDRSGSMGDPPPSDGSTDPKIEILQDAVGVFLDAWEANAMPGDRVGVIDFNGHVNHYEDPATSDILVPVPDSLVEVQGYVAGLSDGGITCMGGAVAEGLDALEESGRRHIILFSDGMQNCNPVMVEDGAFIRILHVDPADVSDYEFIEHIYGDSGVPPKPGIDLEDFDTRIHTIGVGLSGPPWTELMSEIAFETDGQHFETPAPEVDLQDFYLNSLMESFKGATPQILKHAYREFNADQGYSLETCQINSTPRWLTVVLSWTGDPHKNQLVCVLEAPGGNLIDLTGRVKASPRRLVMSMPLPTYSHDKLVMQAGTWRLHIMGKTSGTTPYQCFWIVEDRHLHFDVKFLRRRYTVGTTISFSTKLTLDGKAISPNYIRNARVRVTYPARSPSYLLSRYRVDSRKFARLKKRMQKLGISSEAELKLYLISRDKDFLAKYTKTVSKWVPMSYSRGKLVAKFDFFKEGIHRFDISVKAKDFEGNSFTRTRTFNIYGRIGKIDPKVSRMRIRRLSRDRIEVRILPRDNYRGLLGPGHAKDFKARIGKTILAVKDNLNGYYSMVLTRKQAMSRSLIIRVGKIVLHKGPLA